MCLGAYFDDLRGENENPASDVGMLAHAMSTCEESRPPSNFLNTGVVCAVIWCNLTQGHSGFFSPNRPRRKCIVYPAFRKFKGTVPDLCTPCCEGVRNT